MIFFDTETTGLIKNKALPLINQPRIIEIGAVKDTGEELSLIINPLIKLDPIITKITGLIDKDLESFPETPDGLLKRLHEKVVKYLPNCKVR